MDKLAADIVYRPNFWNFAELYSAIHVNLSRTIT